jgi:hypothetical protein
MLIVSGEAWMSPLNRLIPDSRPLEVWYDRAAELNRIREHRRVSDELDTDSEGSAMTVTVTNREVVSMAY